jgi:hypothetical protein
LAVYLHIFSQTPLHNIITKIVKESARWSIATEQDRTPMISVLHSNYGAGYLWALKDIATSEQIKNATGINVLEFEKQVTDIQDKSTMKND